MAITLRGAREHNLRSVDLDLPTGCIVVLCGVSGSGKSSLAFDTLHAEGQRRYLEALALHRSGAIPLLQPPRVDLVDGLPPTIALAQRTTAPSARSTVGTVTEVDPVLRVLFGRSGTLHCPECGRPVRPETHDEIVAGLLGRPMGARLTIEAPLRAVDEAVVQEVERAGFSRLRVDGTVVRLDELRPESLVGAGTVRIVVDRLRVEPDRRGRIADSVRLASRAGRGVIVVVDGEGAEAVHVDRPLCVHDDLLLPELEPRLLSAFQAPGACPSCDGTGVSDWGVCGACEGTRLSPVARAVRWREATLPELQRLPVVALRRRLEALDGDPVEAVALPDVVRRLLRLEALGLGHLPLSRGADVLSSGELQRIRLARQVASPLSGVLYVLDEPAAGLDDHLVAAVLELLRDLVARGNTVLAVEHHPAVVRAADHVVEFGPGAGRAGGAVIYQGTVRGLLGADTPTGRWLSGRSTLEPRSAVAAVGTATVAGAWRFGTAAPEVRLPRGSVVAITGPSGSGKTALLETLERCLAEQTPPGVVVSGLQGLLRPVVVGRGAARAPRSMPATYIGVWDVLRELLAATREARIRGLSASTFSLNTRGGRCEACRGTGERVVKLGPLPDVATTCPVCSGRRFEADVLEVRWKGHDASELLELPAADARALLAGHPKLDGLLRALVRVGLGYVPLGQSTDTLSGGEARRLVLARELARAARRGAEDTVYLLDEPTTGLHPADVAALVDLLRELADEGATVWLATVDPAVVAASDHAIELPPAPVDNSGDENMDCPGLGRQN